MPKTRTTPPSTPPTTPLRAAIARQLKAQGDPQRAEQQQAYMKSSMPYAGVAAPELKKLCRATFKVHPFSEATAWSAAVADLWRHAAVREERYAAIELLLLPRYRRAWLTPEQVPLLREMIESGAWWDYVDLLASNAMAHLLKNHPQTITPLLYEWAEDSNLWIRRTAILAQLKFYDATDTKLLFFAIQHSMGDKDFFARKAIGWALRQYSKTDAQAVVDFVLLHRENLSALSISEALKVLRKQGYPLGQLS